MLYKNLTWTLVLVSFFFFFKKKAFVKRNLRKSTSWFWYILLVLLLHIIVGRFLPPILWRPLILVTSFFRLCQLSFLALFFALFLWLNVSSRRIWCVILTNNIMDLNLLQLTCVIYAKRCQIYWRFATNDMIFASTLI